MPRGGPRPNSGRPKGSRNQNTQELERWLKASGADGLVAQLSAVAENESAPARVRLEALRRLFAWFASRTVTEHRPSSPPNVFA